MVKVDNHDNHTPIKPASTKQQLLSLYRVTNFQESFQVRPTNTCTPTPSGAFLVRMVAEARTTASAAKKIKAKVPAGHRVW